jgi:hypothetical protein
MFWPIVGGAVLGFVGFAFFAGGWMATRNGGGYEGAMVWGALALLGAVGGKYIRNVRQDRASKRIGPTGTAANWKSRIGGVTRLPGPEGAPGDVTGMRALR